MLTFRNALYVGTVLALAGCQSTDRSAVSYVAVNMPPPVAAQLASDTVGYLSDNLPPARTTVVVQPGITGLARDNVSDAMIAALRQKGYGVIVSDITKPNTGQGTPIRFLVSRIENGVLLRMQYPGREVTRYYVRTSADGLMPASSFIVRESR